MITTTAAPAPRRAQPLARPAFGPVLDALASHAVRLLHRFIAARLAREYDSPIRPLSRRGGFQHTA